VIHRVRARADDGFGAEARPSTSGRKRQLTGVGSMTAIAHCGRWQHEAQRRQGGGLLPTALLVSRHCGARRFLD